MRKCESCKAMLPEIDFAIRYQIVPKFYKHCKHCRNKFGKWMNEPLNRLKELKRLDKESY